jgi:predicted aconitase with swiveling domain
MNLQGRKIYPGVVIGEALVTTMGISFFGGVDPDSGVVSAGAELEDNRLWEGPVFPTGKGLDSWLFIALPVEAAGAPAAVVGN